jgi:hypothetical protein
MHDYQTLASAGYSGFQWDTSMYWEDQADFKVNVKKILINALKKNNNYMKTQQRKRKKFSMKPERPICCLEVLPLLPLLVGLGIEDAPHQLRLLLLPRLHEGGGGSESSQRTVRTVQNTGNRSKHTKYVREMTTPPLDVS